IPAVHGHLADLEHSTLDCACRACYLLFTERGAGRGRYRAVPERYLRDPARPLTAAEWAELDVPVGLAFFLHSSQRGQVCGFYPGPAGVTECTLDLAAWARLVGAPPLLSSPEDDVEAVLVHRTDAGVECFLVPVDVCYELAGRMRMLWRGFGGGGGGRGGCGCCGGASTAGRRRGRASPSSSTRCAPALVTWPRSPDMAELVFDWLVARAERYS